MSALSRGIAFCPIPFRQDCVCIASCFHSVITEVLLPIEVGEEGLKTYPHLPEVPIGIVWRRTTIFSVPDLSVNPLPSSCITSGSVHPDWGRIRQPCFLHTDRRWVGLSSCWYSDRRVCSITLPLSFCGNPIKSGLNWSVSSIQETQKLDEKCKHKWVKQARRHTWGRAQMINQTRCHSLKRCCPRWAQWMLLSCCPGVFQQQCPSPLY